MEKKVSGGGQSVPKAATGSGPRPLVNDLPAMRQSGETSLASRMRSCGGTPPFCPAPIRDGVRHGHGCVPSPGLSLHDGDRTSVQIFAVHRRCASAHQCDFVSRSLRFGWPKGMANLRVDTEMAAVARTTRNWLPARKPKTLHQEVHIKVKRRFTLQVAADPMKSIVRCRPLQGCLLDVG